ncbi:MAG: hypothetical protein ACLFOY_17660 [Desulfatibacillaceae bacterium]
MPSPRVASLVVLLVAVLTVGACSGGSSDAPPAAKKDPPPPNSRISGAVVKGPLSNATVEALYFDLNGDLTPLEMGFGSGKTASDGSYSLRLENSVVQRIIGSPLLLRASGGQARGMGSGQTAPDMYAVVPDPTLLAVDGTAMNLHFSLASTVAVKLLLRQAEAEGGRLHTADAQAAVLTVNNAFNADILHDDPRDPGTGAGALNEGVDTSLDLSDTPGNYDVVDSLADYYAANLADGALDNNMQVDATSAPQPASFTPWFQLDATTGGIDGVVVMSAHRNRPAVGDNGTDSTTITVELSNAAGQPVSGATVGFRVVSGPGSLSGEFATTNASGQAGIQAFGHSPDRTVVVEASYSTPAGGEMARNVSYLVTDCGVPGGITINPDKTTLFADGNDAVMVDISVDALCPGSEVPDGTAVAVYTVSGSARIGEPSLSTTAGAAGTVLTSTSSGTVVLRADVYGDNILYSDEVVVEVLPDPCGPTSPTVWFEADSVAAGYTTTVYARVDPVDAANCAIGQVADGTKVVFSVVSGQGRVANATTLQNGVATAIVYSDESGGTDAVVQAMVTDSEGRIHTGNAPLEVVFDNESMNGSYLATMERTHVGAAVVLFEFFGDGTGAWRHLANTMNEPGVQGIFDYTVSGLNKIEIHDPDQEDVHLEGFVDPSGQNFIVGYYEIDTDGHAENSPWSSGLGTLRGSAMDRTDFLGEYGAGWCNSDACRYVVLSATGTGGPDNYTKLNAQGSTTFSTGKFEYVVDPTGGMELLDSYDDNWYDGGLRPDGNGFALNLLADHTDLMGAAIGFKRSSGLSVQSMRGTYRAMFLHGYDYPTVYEFTFEGNGIARAREVADDPNKEPVDYTVSYSLTPEGRLVMNMQEQLIFQGQVSGDTKEFGLILTNDSTDGGPSHGIGLAMEKWPAP